LQHVSVKQVGEIIGQMPGIVLACQVRRLTYAAIGKAVDFNIWGTKIYRADASIETQAYYVLIMHRIVEPSQVMIHPKQELVHEPRCYGAVQNGGPVLGAYSVGLKIGWVNRIEISDRITASDKSSDTQPLRRSEGIVPSHNAVVADRIVVGASAQI